MNKRIKKKMLHLSPRQIGNNVYTPEEIKSVIMVSLLKHYLIPRIYFTSLDPNTNSVHIWRKKNIKRTLKYMYKHRNCGESIKYKSLAHIRFMEAIKHE